jgi:hypothetical protein
VIFTTSQKRAAAAGSKQENRRARQAMGPEGNLNIARENGETNFGIEKIAATH